MTRDFHGDVLGIIKMKCPEGTARIVPYSASPEPLWRIVGAAQKAIRTYLLDE